MENKFYITLASTEDEETILELQRLSFPHVKEKFTHEWYDWLFNKCPLGYTRTYIIYDKDTGKAVGSNSFRPIRLWFNGKEYNASFSHSTNVHPDYRGYGLFTHLIGDFAPKRERIVNVPICVGQPNRNSYPGFIKGNWNSVCDLVFLAKHDFRNEKHGCIEIDRFDYRVDLFFERLKERFDFIIIKDHEFLNWRTVDKPNTEYTIYVYPITHAAIAGYVILKNYEKKAHIVDIHAESMDVFNSLVLAAEQFAQGSDVLNVWSNLNDRHYYEFLGEGFSVEPENASPLIMRFNNGINQEIGHNYWNFSLIDNDVY